MSSSEEDEYQEPINFVQIEHAIRETSNRIARGVRICSERYQAFQTAERAYDAAYARAYLNADGPATRGNIAPSWPPNPSARPGTSPRRRTNTPSARARLSNRNCEHSRAWVPACGNSSR